MASFVGLTVIVTLKQGAVIQGYVKAVDATTASLVLQDAFLPNTRQQVGNWTIQGPSIADLRVVETNDAPPAQKEEDKVDETVPVQAPALSHVQSSKPQPEQFSDPAILSYTSKPQPKAPLAAPSIQSATKQAQLDDTDDANARSLVNRVRRVSLTKTRTGKPMDDHVHAPHTPEASKRRNKKKRRDGTGLLIDEADAEPSPETRKGASSSQFRGKGWRQTPMLHDQAEAITPAKSAGKENVGSMRKNRKQQGLEREANNNGWATEDATDIQELGEFDFVANLSKFDKRTVFNQIRTEDTTADEERLVHFNRTAPRPGTYGGKNLHPTENVLDSPQVASRLSAQESDSDEGFDIESTRAPRQTLSRASSRRPPYRAGSGIIDDTGSLRGAHSLRNYAGSSSHGAAVSPNPGRFTPPESPASSQILGAHFRITSTDLPCPTIMPAGFAAIEEVAETEFGLTTDIMTENAGRGIAEVAMATLGTATAKRRARDNPTADTRPWALIIAGNHKSGARALAACRHLRSRNIRTLTCLLGFERQTIELEREVRKQADILVKMNGYVRGWGDTKNYLAREGHGPDLVIDALLAASKPFDVLGAEDQKAVLDIVGWSKKGAVRGVTLSVDMPCGINGSTGEPSLIDPITAEVLHIQTNHIVCIGAPRIGLLRAMQKTVLQKTVSPMPPQYSPELLKAQLWVVDIGVEKAWKRSGLAGSRGVKFGKEWVVPVRLVEGVAE